MISRQLSKKRHQKSILKQQRGAIVNQLEEESKKMEEKLKELKKQIKQKKSMKATMNNTQGRFNKLKSKQLNKFLTTTDNLNKTSKFTNNGNELTLFYSQLKMEQYEEQLKKVGIKTKKQLMNLKQADIQKLPIPPGFRIKLKKALLNQKPKTQQKTMQKSQKSQSNQKSTLTQSKQSKQQNLIDIEAIVDKRNQQKQKSILKIPSSKFIQLDPFQQEDVFSYNNFIDGEFLKGEYVSEDYIQNTQFLKLLPSRKINGDFVKTEKQYLKEYYDTQMIVVPLKSCIKKKENKKFKQKKKVHFQQEIILKSELQHKKYPKEGIKDKTLMKNDIKTASQTNTKAKKQIQYCWGCCKLIKQQKLIYQNYLFCSPKCENQFKKQVIKTCDNCSKQTNISQLIISDDMKICQQCLQNIDQQDAQHFEKIDLTL